MPPALLMTISGLSPAQLLGALGARGPTTQPLYADLAAHFPLNAAEWQRVPTPCAGLGRALPAVLARQTPKCATCCSACLGSTGSACGRTCRWRRCAWGTRSAAATSCLPRSCASSLRSACFDLTAALLSAALPEPAFAHCLPTSLAPGCSKPPLVCPACCFFLCVLLGQCYRPAHKSSGQQSVHAMNMMKNTCMRGWGEHDRSVR